MQMKGIDVSHWQGDIDFKQVKKGGIDFVIIKAGEWDHTDDRFEENFKNAKAVGLHVGLYWYCDGETLEQIEMEADSCITALEGKQFDFPIYIDLENASQYNLGKQFCSDAVRAFCGKLEKAGYFAGLYTSTSWLQNVIDDDVQKKYTLWVADWRGYCGYDGKYEMWQYGAGYVPGINGMTDLNIIDFGIDTDYPGSVVADGVDLDYAYKDFSSVIIQNGYNNYPKSSEEWKNDECKKIADVLTISDAEAALSGDTWFLVDKSCSFTLETLPYAKVRIYIVGGGCDGAEWRIASGVNSENGRTIDYGGRGGSVYVTDTIITGNVKCRAFIGNVNQPTSTSLKIENDIYKCDDSGSFWRKATASAVVSGSAGNVNAESGANGIWTPYGFVGSSGGGGGTEVAVQGDTIRLFAGKCGVGAGDGGEAKENGADAQNYGCGGGASGFGGFHADGSSINHAGKGRGGCVIFEILNSGECDNSPNNPDNITNGNCGCGSCCNQLSDTFVCSDEDNGSLSSGKNYSYSLSYDGETAVETEKTEITPDIRKPGHSADNSSVNNSNGSCGCGKSGCNSSSANTTNSGGNCNCGCGTGSSSSSGCVSYDVQRWGENWLLFDTTGEYTLNFETDVDITAYIVGGGTNGKDGLYYNKTAYGGDGGIGGLVNIVKDIKSAAGEHDIRVLIGDTGGFGLTSVVIDDNEYCCNGQGYTTANYGNQGICGKSSFRNASNGTNGIETPFGWVGSSGGGGAAYYNGDTASYGRGGMSAGNGGKIIDGKSTKGERAKGYGCGGGGGAASPTSWCKGGKGKRGCVILTWS